MKMLFCLAAGVLLPHIGDARPASAGPKAKRSPRPGCAGSHTVARSAPPDGWYAQGCLPLTPPEPVTALGRLRLFGTLSS